MELEQPIDAERQSKLAALSLTVNDREIHVPEPALLYPVLDILRPLPIVKIEKDQANLTDVFLRIVQEGRNA